MIKKLTFAPTILMLTMNAFGAIASCDGTYKAETLKPGSLRIERNTKTIFEKINHQATGGNFNSNNSYLAIYGPPLKISPQSPQASFLTLYQLSGKPKIVATRSYGSGIYSAKFSEDGKYVAVDTAYGYDILNIRNGTSEFKNQDYELNIPLDECKKSTGSEHASSTTD